MMKNPKREEEKAIKDIRSFLDKRKLKQLKIEYLELLKNFLNIGKKKIIINQ